MALVDLLNRREESRLISSERTIRARHQHHLGVRETITCALLPIDQQPEEPDAQQEETRQASTKRRAL